MRILVIDDDTLLRQTMRRMLESAGHEVVEAANGRTGVEAFRTHRTDAVISDIIMPDKEGIETIREIRGLSPTVRIVAVSGGGRNHNMEFLTIAGKLGADATLAKPFRKEQLLACVEGREPAAGTKVR
jgi:DNA-binding response OmpR family regulator